MKVLVTGATGFIGAHTVTRLLQGGHDVAALTRTSAPALERAGMKAVRGDVADPADVLRAMAGCEALMHLANVYSFWERDPRIYWRINVEATRGVLDAAVEARLTKVIHVSTYAVFAASARRPFTEESPYDPAPASAYVRSKLAGERAAWDLRERRGLPLVVIYPANALGAGDPKATGQYVADLVRGRLPATLFPDTVLTFVHVGDVAEAIVRALEKPGNVGERYLVGNARMSLGEMNRMIAQVAGVRLPRLTLPGPLALALAAVLTRLADWTGRPPPWGMARDQVQTLRHSLEADGSKAERELGLAYTPIRRAVEQAVASLR